VFTQILLASTTTHVLRISANLLVVAIILQWIVWQSQESSVSLELATRLFASKEEMDASCKPFLEPSLINVVFAMEITLALSFNYQATLLLPLQEVFLES